MERCADANQIFISLIKIANFRKPKALITCKNCSTVLEPKHDYCSHCGAKVIRNRLTLKSLFQNYTEAFFSYDNTFLKTIVYLFKDPRDVIDSYVQGVRKKYLAPLSFFAIALTISGLYFFIIKNYFPNFFDMAASGLSTDERQVEFTRTLTQKATEFNALINFLLMPLVAGVSRLVFWKQGYNYTEHLVIYFYTMSLFSMFASVLNLLVLSFSPVNFMVTSVVIYIFLFGYHSYVLKQLFKLSFKKLLLKLLIFVLITMVAYIGFVVIMIAAALTGIIEIEALKPQP